MIGLAIGVAALILTLSVMRGFEDEVEDKVASMDGHLRLSSALGNEVPLPDSLIERIQAYSEVERVIPFTARHALVRRGSRSDGVFLMGADLEQLREVVNIHEFITAGTYPSPDDSAAIILGEKLAKQLQVGPGEEVILFDVAYLLEEQGIRGREFTVAATYRSGMVEYDQLLAFTTLGSAHALFGLSRSPSRAIINLSDRDRADGLSAALEDDLGFPYYLLSWRQRHANLFQWLKGQQTPILIVFGFIAAVALVNILSTLSLIVVEKQRDIGILRSLGFGRRRIQKIFLYQGSIIGSVGSGAGIGLALLLGFLQRRFQILALDSDIYFMDALPVQWSWQSLILIPFIALVLSLLAAVWPAKRAAAIHPAEALRYE
ncbi:MAG: ABC transporter permease [Fidelibacterota bacterium]|nr:MAG: ABC transporter permease [Candidatus Neomarinimicrobiota bacterium]